MVAGAGVSVPAGELGEYCLAGAGMAVDEVALEFVHTELVDA